MLPRLFLDILEMEVIWTVWVMKTIKNSRKSLEQNKRETPMTFTGRVIMTGFVGGVLWSALGEPGVPF